MVLSRPASSLAALRLPLVHLHCDCHLHVLRRNRNDMSTLCARDHENGWDLRFKAGRLLQKRKAATGAAAPASSKRKKLQEVRLVFKTSF